MISLFHLRAWKKVSAASLVAVCDPSVDRARGRATGFGIPAVYADLDEMLAREALDAVDIAAPTDLHVDLVRRATAQGVSVLCQKPLAATYAEAAALAEDIGDRVRVMVHENWRFRPHYRTIRLWLNQGRLGRIQEMTLIATSSGLLADASGARPAIVREPPLRTARPLVLGSVLIHHLDVARSLLGPLTILAARVGHEVDAVLGETRASVFLQTAARAPVIVAGNMAVPGAGPTLEDRLRLVGTEATVTFELGRLELGGRDPAAFESSPADAYQAGFDDCIAHFAECLATGAPFETDIRDNLITLRLVDDAFGLAAV